MRSLQRLLLSLPLVLLGLALGAGCQTTVPSLLLNIGDPAGLAPTQLRITVSVETLQTDHLTRPEVPNGPLTSPQTLRLFMPDAAIGKRVELTVEALREGVVVGTAATVTVLKAVEDTELRVALVPVDVEVCDASTCPFGCCDGDVCIEGAHGACGTGGGACHACDVTSTDQCIEGSCRCGADAPCPVGYRCEEGACAPSGEGQSCTVDAQCTDEPGQCYRKQGVCGEDGKCAYAYKDATESCDDRDSCTDGDHCDGEGRCVSTPKVCNDPDNECLSDAGWCENGTCRYDAKADTVECSDNNQCTLQDRCDGAGTCKGSPRVCNDPPIKNGCWKPNGTCIDGECTYEPDVGASCGTNDACTTSKCNASGQCVSTPTVCTPPSSCHVASCDASTGCEFTVDEGAPCTGTNACMEGTTCLADGSCGGGTPKACPPPPNTLCWDPPTCNPTTGACTQNRKQTGTPCGTNSNVCQFNACNAEGQCVAAPKPDGFPCGQLGIGCNACQGGVCVESCGPGETCCGNVCKVLKGGEVCSIVPEEPL